MALSTFPTFLLAVAAELLEVRDEAGHARARRFELAGEGADALIDGGCVLPAAPVLALCACMAAMRFSSAAAFACSPAMRTMIVSRFGSDASSAFTSAMSRLA